MPIIPESNSCGADDQAETIFDKLVEEGDFEFPDVNLDGPEYQVPSEANNPLYTTPNPITLDQLTSRTIGGSGVFDAIMDSVHAHLKKEFEQQRISGREYADVYTASIQASMAQAVSFLLGKDQAYWQAIMAQTQARTAEVQAITARIELQNTKLQYYTLKATAKEAAASYALKMMQLPLADAEYCIKLLEKSALTADVEAKVFTNTNMLPLQRDRLGHEVGIAAGQVEGIGWDNQGKQINIEEMLPKQVEMLDSQMLTAASERDMAAFRLTEILPQEAALLSEQVEVQRAQTLGNRRDGAIVAGVIGLDNDTKRYTLQNLMPAQRDMTLAEIIGVQRDNDTKLFNLDQMLPKQLDMTDAQISGIEKDNEVKDFNIANMLPKQMDMLDAQIAGIEKDNEVKDFNIDEMLPAQKKLVEEQTEGARAQTMNTRTDGSTIVTGLIGKQKDLYTQQITSYERDAEVKAAKMFLDSWVTRKTIDEGTPLPNTFDTASIETIFQRIKLQNGLNT